MRARTLREGSVGLFILVGLALFGTIAFWLRGVTIRRDTYTFTITFENSNGLVVGGSVRYRGVKVGTITEIVPTSNGIDAIVAISPASLLIPKNVQVEANQAGLISETSIDMNPIAQLANTEDLSLPLSANCDSEIIVCDGDRLQGVTGISINAAMRSTITLSERFTDPEFFDNILDLTENAAIAAQEVSNLSKELALLSKVGRAELTRTSRNFGAIADTSARQINSTAEAYRQTALELSQLTDNLNTLVVENRTNISSTLASIENTSAELSGLVATFNQTLDAAQVEQLIANLETLSANAAAASNTLKIATDAFADPTTILTLQQTLQAARVTFENAQKITSDLDELTGDPSFRRNVRDLIDGLNSLVSTTEILEQEVYLAQQLPTLAELAARRQRPDEPTSRTPKSTAKQPPTYDEVQSIFRGETEPVLEP